VSCAGPRVAIRRPDCSTLALAIFLERFRDNLPLELIRKLSRIAKLKRQARHFPFASGCQRRAVRVGFDNLGLLVQAARIV